MKIFEIIDPEQERQYRVRKGELERLRASDPLMRQSEYLKSIDDAHPNRWNTWERDDPRWAEIEKRMDYFKRLRNVHHRRWHDMTKDVDYRKGQLTHDMYKEQPTGMFVTYDAIPGRVSPELIDPLGQMINQANENLDFPASHFITSFVGHDHSINGSDAPWGGGGWSEHKLEDAFSDTPSEQGLMARQQLEAAMAPIKQQLKARFGNIITLYRSQRPAQANEKHRNVLSWTASQKFSQFHGGDEFSKIEAQIPVDDIVWITNRANQQEFIIYNRQNTSHYISPNRA